MISEEQLASLEHLANEATKGPWYQCKDRVCDRGPWHECRDTDCYVFPIKGNNNAKFVAASREAVPALIARVRELEAALSKERKYADDNCMIGVFHGTSMANDKIRQLEKEADWLAHKLRTSYGCPREKDKGLCLDNRDCAACWRDVAREAVQNV